ncbi:MAG TPA: efflux RND transporter periplasmic adaptor subunit [Syntrophomonadaceae bacterium]|nr:efflux RND transporter periplasmic adaptor subunit [Syntrophomonadaceae bacterium]
MSTDIPPVRTQVVRLGDGSQDYKYAGEVRSRYESNLAFQVSGKIINRYVDVGSIVHKGDVLMQIDSRDAQQTVDSYAAQIASVESQLKLAGDTLARCKQLYEAGALSKAELDKSQTAYDTASAQLNQLQAVHNLYENQLEYTSLRADRDGVVTGVFADVGQVVMAMATAQTVVTVAQNQDLEVEINVPENRIKDLNKAKQIKVSFWALPNVSLAGQTREISPMADPVARTFKVRITLLNPPPEIKLGMTSNVVFNSPGDSSAGAVIPLSAVYQNGDTPSVWIVNGDTVSLRKIKPDSYQNDQVRVSEGLKNGDIIVTAGVHKLHEGQKVLINEGAKDI